MDKTDATLVDLITSVVKGFDRLEDCLDRVHDQLEQLDTRLDGLEGRMLSQEAELREVVLALRRLEGFDH